MDQSRRAIPCPSCEQSLAINNDNAYCPGCDLHLVGVSTRGKRMAAYALSLPERLSRVMAGSAAGLLKGVSELALPEGVRETKLYQVLLQKNLRYLIQKVGDVKGVYSQDETLPSNYVGRKFVGNFIELTGILTLRASPVWILALVSDLSGGTKVFLKELTDELKREGLLDPATPVNSVDQLLDSLQSFSGQVADRIDMPPLSVTELRETFKYLREQAQTLGLKRAAPHEEVSRIYEGMKDAALKQNRSIYEISSALAMNAMNQLQRSGRTAVTGARVARAIMDRTILQYYTRGLEELAEEGYYRYLARTSKPYLKAVARHLARKNITWTERYFLSRARDRIRPFSLSHTKDK